MMLNFRGVEMHSIYMFILFFFFNQQTEYEMRISDWSSDVCSSDLLDLVHADRLDRTVEHDLALDDLVAVGLKRLDDVAYRDRAVELAGVRRLADQRQRGAVEALCLLLGIGSAGSVLRLPPLPICFEELSVVLVGSPPLLSPPQELS